MSFLIESDELLKKIRSGEKSAITLKKDLIAKQSTLKNI